MADIPCTTPTNYFRSTVGIVFLLGSFSVFYLVLSGKTSLEWKDVALIIVGALIAKIGTIMDLTFGSSQSSDHKTDIMADTAKAAVVTTTETAKVLAAEAAEEKK